MENKIDKLVLEFDKLIEKILEGKEQLSDFRRFRNKLIKRLNAEKIKKEISHK